MPETQPIRFKARGEKLRTEEDVQFFGGEESAFEYMVPDFAASYAVNVLLRLRASVGVRSRRKGVCLTLVADDPTGLGTRFGLSWTGEICRAIYGHWALDLRLRQGGKPGKSGGGFESIGQGAGGFN